QAPRENAEPGCTKFETSCKNQTHPRGGQTWPKQPINKTIGINKLGTLLSSQTTDTFEYFSNNYLNSSEFFVIISSLRCF
ncbi:hypothetical protein, partial [Arthrobacter oryzae]|uniref:hypothetical protein n=1 Tax=Arthrobacter oryzae TaxID=409290 RepID=UPI0030C950E2